MTLTSSAQSIRATGSIDRATRRFSAVMCILYLLVPVDFVIVDRSIARILYYLSAASLLAVVIWIFLEFHQFEARLAAIMCVLAVTPFASGQQQESLSGLYIVLPVILGMLAARHYTLRVSAGLLAVMFIILALEYLIGDYWYSQILGEARFRSFYISDFRARGIIGQAVPAAMISTIIATTSILLLNGRKNAAPVMGIVAIAWAGSLFLTGTRSALIISVIGLIIILWTSAAQARRSITVIAMVGLLATLSALLWTRTSSWLVGGRVFDFDSIRGSASGEVRSNALNSLENLPDPCGLACDLVGHGGRSLQSELSRSPSRYGLSTVDNQFLSMFWDFGILTLLVIAILAGWALYSLYRRSTTANTVGGTIVLLTLVSGLFYDSLYTRPSAVLIGVGIGLMVTVTTTARTGRES